MEDMHSRHAFILALMLGAAGLIVALGGFFVLELVNQAEPYLGNQTLAQKPEDYRQAPTLITTLKGATVKIVELDKQGQEIRAIYTSNLNDQVADFSLFAVPQTNYQGLVYVQSVQDAASDRLIVYPLEVATGDIRPATLNLPSTITSVSPDQTKAAILSLSPATMTIYAIASGENLATLTLGTDERWQEPGSKLYSGDGALWINDVCLEHQAWTNTGTKIKSLCI